MRAELLNREGVMRAAPAEEAGRTAGKATAAVAEKRAMTRKTSTSMQQRLSDRLTRRERRRLLPGVL